MGRHQLRAVHPPLSRKPLPGRPYEGLLPGQRAGHLRCLAIGHHHAGIVLGHGIPGPEPRFAGTMALLALTCTQLRNPVTGIAAVVAGCAAVALCAPLKLNIIAPPSRPRWQWACWPAAPGCVREPAREFARMSSSPPGAWRPSRWPAARSSWCPKDGDLPMPLWLRETCICAGRRPGRRGGPGTGDDAGAVDRHLARRASSSARWRAWRSPGGAACSAFIACSGRDALALQFRLGW